MLQFNQWIRHWQWYLLILILLISLIFSLIHGQNMVDSAADKELVYAEFHRMKVVAFLVSCEVPGGSQWVETFHFSNRLKLRSFCWLTDSGIFHDRHSVLTSQHAIGSNGYISFGRIDCRHFSKIATWCLQIHKCISGTPWLNNLFPLLSRCFP